MKIKKKNVSLALQIVNVSLNLLFLELENGVEKWMFRLVP